MLELNQEFYPGSAAIDQALAQLHLTRGEQDEAIARFRAVLTKQPRNEPRATVSRSSGSLPAFYFAGPSKAGTRMHEIRTSIAP
jgi:hypothetical protein